MNVILLGLPGAGKGTQAKFITEHLNIPHISTGDLFRKAYQENTVLGIQANNFMNKGELVPDKLTINIAIERLEIDECSRGFLLDGFPRNIAQASALRDHLREQSSQVDHVIYVEVEEALLIKRLTGRRICKDCGTSYHLLFHPSVKDGFCDECEGTLIQRGDDQEETVKERLKVNQRLTNDLINFYQTEGSLRVVNGTQEISSVTRDIISLFE